MAELKEKFRINPSVVATRMSDGAVLIDSATGDCFELNRIGVRVWERLERGEDLVGMIESLAAEYAVDRSIMSTDVAALVEDLARHGILLAPSR